MDKLAAAIKKAADRWKIPLTESEAEKISDDVLSLTDEQLQELEQDDTRKP